MRTLIIFVTLLLQLARCSDFHTVNEIEGDVAELDFKYPCNSAYITLRQGYKAPFYNTANLETIPLLQHLNLSLQNETESNNCYLYLTFNPITRHDVGAYILTAYKHGHIIEDTRISLRVDYPPGKAVCESSEVHIDREWVLLHCKAPVGSQPGQIVCYQNGIKLPTSSRQEK